MTHNTKIAMLHESEWRMIRFFAPNSTVIEVEDGYKIYDETGRELFTLSPALLQKWTNFFQMDRMGAIISQALGVFR